MVPERYRILSGSALKTIAVVTMIIDHIAMVLLKDNPASLTLLNRTVKLYDLMRITGRITFPIYCSLLVEGFLHTRNRARYAVRLFAFALVSEIPFDLAHYGKLFYNNYQNVFFTLLLGFLGLCCLDRLRDEPVKMGALLVLVYGAALVLKADYKVSGLGLIMAMYLARESGLVQGLLAGCILSWWPWAAGLSVVPFSLYNGKRGYIRSRVLQYAFYAAYPLHLLVLYLIRANTVGY